MLFTLATPQILDLAPWHAKISEKKKLFQNWEATNGSFKVSPETLNNKPLMDGNGEASILYVTILKLMFWVPDKNQIVLFSSKNPLRSNSETWHGLTATPFYPSFQCPNTKNFQQLMDAVVTSWSMVEYQYPTWFAEAYPQTTKHKQKIQLLNGSLTVSNAESDF